MAKAAQSRAALISEHHRVAEPDPPRHLDIRVGAATGGDEVAVIVALVRGQRDPLSARQALVGRGDRRTAARRTHGEESAACCG